MLLTRAGSGMVICVPVGNANKNDSGFREKTSTSTAKGLPSSLVPLLRFTVENEYE